MTGLLDDLQDELTKSARDSMHGSWHYFAATHKLLYADTERCGKYFKQAREAIAARPKNQNPTEALDLYAQCDFWYRILLRVFCTEIEGTLSTMLEIIVWANERGEIALTTNEGDSIKKVRMPAKRKFNLVFALFPRVFGSSFKVDYSDNGWNCLNAVIDARNTFTHPIGLQGRFSTEPGNDYNNLLEAIRWFYGLWGDMASSIPEYSNQIDGGA